MGPRGRRSAAEQPVQTPGPRSARDVSWDGDVTPATGFHQLLFRPGYLRIPALHRPRNTRNTRNGLDQGPRNTRNGLDQGAADTRNGLDQGPRMRGIRGTVLIRGRGIRGMRGAVSRGSRGIRGTVLIRGRGITRNTRRSPDQGPRNTRNARSGPWSGPRRRGDVGGDPPLPVGLTRPDAQIRAVLRRRFRHVVASAGVAQIARRGGSAGGGPCRHRHGMTGEPARNLVGPDRHRLTGADAMKRGWGTVRNTQSRPAWLVCSAALSLTVCVEEARGRSDRLEGRCSPTTRAIPIECRSSTTADLRQRTVDEGPVTKDETEDYGPSGPPGLDGE